MFSFSNQLLEAHAQDAQRSLEKQRLSRGDMDEWEMRLKVYDPTKRRLAIRTPAFLVRFQESFAGLRADLAPHLASARRSLENAGASPRLALPKAIGLFMGASFFAYLLSIGLHELGHYLASIALGVPERGIVLDPFGANYNIYLGNTHTALGTPLRSAFSGLAGPLFNLLMAVAVSLLLWRKRSPAGLPLLMLGSYALLQESINMVVNIAEGWGDWNQLVTLGAPPAPLLLMAVLMLAAGSLWLMQLLPVAGIQYRDSFWRKLAVIQSGIPLLFLCSVIYQTWYGVDFFTPVIGGTVFSEGLLANKLAFMLASAGLTTLVIALYKPLYHRLKKLSTTPPARVGWRDALIAVSLGAAIVVVQLVFFNDPNAVVLVR